MRRRNRPSHSLNLLHRNSGAYGPKQAMQPSISWYLHNGCADVDSITWLPSSSGWCSLEVYFSTTWLCRAGLVSSIIIAGQSSYPHSTGQCGAVFFVVNLFSTARNSWKNYCYKDISLASVQLVALAASASSCQWLQLRKSH